MTERKLGAFMKVYPYSFIPYDFFSPVDEPDPRYIYNFFRSFEKFRFERRGPFCLTSTKFPGYSASF